MPLKLENDFLRLAVSDPTDFSALNDLRLITGKEITPVLANKTIIRKYIESFYGSTGLTKSQDFSFNKNLASKKKVAGGIKLHRAGSSPIISFLIHVCSSINEYFYSFPIALICGIMKNS